jgi:hypothetical protein
MNFIPGTGTRAQDMDMGHKFRPNVHAKRVERMLLQSGFNIDSQVLNYDNRVVGLIASYAAENQPDLSLSLSGYIPTESSEIIISGESDKQVKQYGVGYGPKYALKYVDDSSISWLSYQLTLSFLKFVHDRTGLPCQPVVNVTDDADPPNPLIIGVLTETNQFVRISSPEPVQRLPDGTVMDIGMATATANAIGVKDHHTVDMAVLLDRGYNTSSRSKFIRMIELEANFYNVFRITARHLLNSPSDFNSPEQDADTGTDSISKEIYDIVFSENENDNPSGSSGYENKLSRVTALLRSLMQNSIQFIDYDTTALSRIETCIAPGSCDGTRAYCARDDDRSNSTTPCRLRIPAHRLMFHRDNSNPVPNRNLMEPLFYSRLADELIRYPRMRDFMFTERPNDYYIASRIPQVVCEDELLLTQSMIDGTDSQNGYFTSEANQPDVGQGKQAMNINTSVFNVKRKRVVETHRRNAVTDAQMKTHVQTRQEVVKMSAPKSVLACLEPKRVPYTMEVFQGVFPGDILDAKIVKNGDITLALFINLLHVYNKLNIKENVAAVKQKLIETYDDIFRTYSTVTPMKVCNLWMKSGIQMNRLARDVISGLLTIENAIKSSVYTLTPLDLWILSTVYELPVILYSAGHEAGGNASDLSARFFCNGCSGSGAGSRARILYSAADSESYCVIGSMHSMNSFPLYGIVQYGDGEDKLGFAIRKDDIKLSEPVAALYNKNERIADFIDKWNVSSTAEPAAPIATSASAKPLSAPMNLGLEMAKSLPLMMRKPTVPPRIEEDEEEEGEDSGHEAEQDEQTRLSIQEWDDEEVHNPQIRTLLQSGKAKLNVALERLDSPAIDPTSRQDSHAIQEKVDNLRI